MPGYQEQAPFLYTSDLKSEIEMQVTFQLRISIYLILSYTAAPLYINLHTSVCTSIMLQKKHAYLQLRNHCKLRNFTLVTLRDTYVHILNINPKGMNSILLSATPLLFNNQYLFACKAAYGTKSRPRALLTKTLQALRDITC